MRGGYLKVMFRHGRPLAAYYYLPRGPGQKTHHVLRIEPGLVVDFARDGRPTGVEITAPNKLSLAALNRVLRDLGFSAVTRSEVGPLLAAWGGRRQEFEGAQAFIEGTHGRARPRLWTSRYRVRCGSPVIPEPLASKAFGSGSQTRRTAGDELRFVPLSTP
jgi:hypothetical protein